MGQFDLNLSTRPFRSYRVQTFLLTLGLIALIAASIWQVIGFKEYSALVSQIRRDAQNAQVESNVLGRQMAELDAKLSRPEAVGKLSEIQFLNQIIAKKTFSWTRIFSDLEELMPETVHLVSLRPDLTDNGAAILHMEVRARSVQDWAKFGESLQSVPAFDNLIVASEEKRQDVKTNVGEVHYTFTVQYHPDKEGQ
jgi:type IV pilus assembly protein PilN